MRISSTKTETEINSEFTNENPILFIDAELVFIDQSDNWFLLKISSNQNKRSIMKTSLSKFWDLNPNNSKFSSRIFE